MTEGNNRISLSLQLLWSVMDGTETGRWTGRFAIIILTYRAVKK